MILLAAALFAPTTLFDDCLSSFSKLRSYTVHIKVNSSIPGRKQQTQFDLAVSGSDVLLRMREPASGIVDRSDRSFLLKGDHLVAYDAVANEKLRKTLAGHDSVTSRLTALLGPLDESLSIVLDPAAMGRFFSRYSRLRDWSLTQKNEVSSIGRYSQGVGMIVRFVGAHPLLKEVWLKKKDSLLYWTYTITPGASLDLAIPRDARPVSSFYVREAPPKFKSAEAQQVVQAMIKAYGGLTNGIIDIQSDTGGSRLYLSGRRLREDRAHFTWSYDGSHLWMVNGRTGQFYTGKAYRVILSEYVTKVGGEVDPIIRRIIAGRVPYQDLFASQATVTLIGASGDGEKRSDVLEVKTPNLRISLFVRRNTHLLESMDTETVDARRKVMTHSSRRFSYRDLGTPMDRDQFMLGPGKAKVLPLPNVDTGRTSVGSL